MTHTLWVQEKVRQGEIAVRKVRVEVKPADLFAKHLPSEDHIHHPLFLLGCEYHSGRAAGAPPLRPHDVGRQKDGHLPDDKVLPNFTVYEADLHNEKRLPLQYEPDYISCAFPRLEAAAAQPNLEDWTPGDTEGWGNTSEKQSGMEPEEMCPETAAMRRCGHLRLPAKKSEIYKGSRQ